MTERLTRLEAYVKDQANWKNQYQRSLDELNKVLEQIHELTDKISSKEQELIETKKKLGSQTKDIETAKELKDLFKKLLFEDLETPKNFKMPSTIDFEHREITINLTNKTESIKLTTKNQIGQIMYVAIKELSKDGFTEKELSDGLKEHGWNIAHSSLAPHLGTNLPKQGLLISLDTKPAKYRIPSKIKLNVSEE